MIARLPQVRQPFQLNHTSARRRKPGSGRDRTARARGRRPGRRIPARSATRARRERRPRERRDAAQALTTPKSSVQPSTTPSQPAAATASSMPSTSSCGHGTAGLHAVVDDAHDFALRLVGRDDDREPLFRERILVDPGRQRAVGRQHAHVRAAEVVQESGRLTRHVDDARPGQPLAHLFCAGMGGVARHGEHRASQRLEVARHVHERRHERGASGLPSRKAVRSGTEGRFSTVTSRWSWSRVGRREFDDARQEAGRGGGAHAADDSQLFHALSQIPSAVARGTHGSSHPAFRWSHACRNSDAPGSPGVPNSSLPQVARVPQRTPIHAKRDFFANPKQGN